MSMHFKFLKGEQKRLPGRELTAEVFHPPHHTCKKFLGHYLCRTAQVLSRKSFTHSSYLSPWEGKRVPLTTFTMGFWGIAASCVSHAPRPFSTFTWKTSESHIWSTIILTSEKKHLHCTSSFKRNSFSVFDVEIETDLGSTGTCLGVLFSHRDTDVPSYPCS